MNPRSFVVLVAVAVTVAAGVLLLSGVTATTAAGASVSCGTAYQPDNRSGQQQSDGTAALNEFRQLNGNPNLVPNTYAGFAQVCADAISARQGWGYGLLGLGLVGLLGGAAVRRKASGVED